MAMCHNKKLYGVRNYKKQQPDEKEAVLKLVGVFIVSMIYESSYSAAFLNLKRV